MGISIAHFVFCSNTEQNIAPLSSDWFLRRTRVNSNAECVTMRLSSAKDNIHLVSYLKEVTHGGTVSKFDG